jgi:DNA-binding transcriptional ArsR family regulator
MIRRLWRRLLKRSETAIDLNSSDSSSARRTGISDHDIERSVSSLELCAEICACAVVIGIGLEYWPKLIAFWNSLDWKTFNELIAGILVFLSIAGEILFSRLASRKQHQLRTQDQLRIAELNRLAAEESLARVNVERILKRRTMSRHLDNDEEAELIEKLRPFAGQTISFLVPRARTMEQGLFASQLKRIVHAAGWIEENAQFTLEDVPAKGINIFLEKETG